MRRFVILAAPRTGSNMLCTLLQSHPNVLCHHELFNPTDIFYALPLRASDFNLGSMQYRDEQPKAFLKQVWSHHQGHSCVGFKMTHRQHLAAFSSVCEDPSISKIVLKRKARLKTYVSRLIAEQSGVWEDYQRRPPSSQPRPVTVDYQQLQSAIELNDQYYSHLDNVIKGPRLNVLYENLGHKKTHENLLGYLNLPTRKLLANSRQQNRHPLSALVKNKDELAKQLNKNPEDECLLTELKRNACFF